MTPPLKADTHGRAGLADLARQRTLISSDSPAEHPNFTPMLIAMPPPPEELSFGTCGSDDMCLPSRLRRIPYYKVGHLVRFDVADIDRWLALNRIEPPQPNRPPRRT